ncbi:MAG: nicotinate-nucleotide adenylyltransferase [Deltaproteobacteria bacterium]|nr:nicotinate-nucleotide adenylyltransferase [Deltaproteobacteria bacterium]
MRLGVFGGTFNPIHLGHLRAAEEVRENLAFDKIIFVPSFIPPHKDLYDVVEGHKRLEIVRRAISEYPYFDVSSFEIDQGGKSYSIRTLEHLRDTYNATPYFILGQDAFDEISTWFDTKRLFSVAHFVVMSRPGTERKPLSKIMGGIADTFQTDENGFVNKLNKKIVYIDITPLDISSSAIRRMSKQGRSITFLVPPEVEAYIKQERIYT